MNPMYSVAVRRNKKKASADEASTSDSPAPSLATTPLASARTVETQADTDIDSSAEVVAFTAGNPRVEHITGIVHLYRHMMGVSPGSPDRLSDKKKKKQQLPPERSTHLCILSLPVDMGFAELCTFISSSLKDLSTVRLVRRESGDGICLVLMQFKTQMAADTFYLDFNSKPFCLLEPDILCRLVFVKGVDIDNVVTPPKAPLGSTELPACPVCLERLDDHISGIVTTVCNHKFHNECLRRWSDTSCPVCRYCHAAIDSTNSSRCAACSTTVDLWICLICGHIGCGRYKGSHAADHWQESGHGYALELESQRVWDYVNDQYVHRLIQSKTDGKLVEVPSPLPAPVSNSSTDDHGGCMDEECRQRGEREMDPEMEEAIIVSKLDAIAEEYNHLLVNQLESQRDYFEKQVARLKLEAEQGVELAEEKMKRAEEAALTAHASTTVAENKKQSLEDKLAKVLERLKKMESEHGFLKQLNDTLLANQKEYSSKLQETEKKIVERDGIIIELQEQVRDLMVFIDAREALGKHEELEGGSVSLPAASAGRRRGSGKKNSR